ncbi:MAG: hypothetical protein M3311_01360 [Thermoproteota archaeon]|nr:hypothetical protein [Thermoproteota archaeon]
MIGSKAAYQDSWIRFTVCRLLLWGRNNRSKVTMVFLGQIRLGFHRTRIDTVFGECCFEKRNSKRKACAAKNLAYVTPSLSVLVLAVEVAGITSRSQPVIIHYLTTFLK